MHFANALFQRFRSLVLKRSQADGQDDAFALRLQRLQRAQGARTPGLVFRNQPSHRPA